MNAPCFKPLNSGMIINSKQIQYLFFMLHSQMENKPIVECVFDRLFLLLSHSVVADSL